MKRKEPGPGGTLVLSFLVHLAVFFIFTQLDLISAISTDRTPVYYVDVVNLPVASPQAGTPPGEGAAAVPEPKPPAPKPPPPQPEEMKIPTAKQQPASRTAQPAKPSASPDSAKEFEERLAKLERDAEARHQAAALEAARRRAAAGTGKGPVGMPGAVGKEAGSDYASYIRSRLEDAFRMEDTFRPDRNKIVEIRLTIDRTGKIIARRFERSSNDIMFNNAVDRAISRAERDFKPPPGGGTFEHGFVFRPQGVGKN